MHTGCSSTHDHVCASTPKCRVLPASIILKRRALLWLDKASLSSRRTSVFQTWVAGGSTNGTCKSRRIPGCDSLTGSMHDIAGHRIRANFPRLGAECCRLRLSWRKRCRFRVQAIAVVSREWRKSTELSRSLSPPTSIKAARSMWI